MTFAGEMPDVMTSAIPTRQVNVDSQQERVKDELVHTQDHQYHKPILIQVHPPAAQMF